MISLENGLFINCHFQILYFFGREGGGHLFFRDSHMLILFRLLDALMYFYVIADVIAALANIPRAYCRDADIMRMSEMARARGMALRYAPVRCEDKR